MNKEEPRLEELWPNCAGLSGLDTGGERPIKQGREGGTLGFFGKRDREPILIAISLSSRCKTIDAEGEMTFLPSFLRSFVRSTLVEQAVGSVKKGKKKEKGRKKAAGGRE